MRPVDVDPSDHSREALDDVFARLDEPKQPVPSRVPTWVRWLAIVALVVVLLILTFAPGSIPGFHVLGK
jgi:hypothetical protein